MRMDQNALDGCETSGGSVCTAYCMRDVPAPAVLVTVAV